MARAQYTTYTRFIAVMYTDTELSTAVDRAFTAGLWAESTDC